MYLLLMTLATLTAACTRLDVSGSGVCELADSLASTANVTYDMLKSQGRRKAPSAMTASEDRLLPGASRRQMQGGIRTLAKNSSFLGWMLRQHLNWCVAASFQSITGVQSLDDEIESWWQEQTQADRYEFRGMLDAEQYARLCESHAVLDGDCGTLFLDSGRVQGIEGDRIRDPQTGFSDADNWFNGCHVNAAGVPVEYALHRRKGGWSTLEFERMVPAGNMHMHGYADQRFDQYRGVSPISSAYNQLTDIYEAEALWLVKAKIAGMLGYKIKRGASDSLGLTETVDADTGRKSYAAEFNAGTPMSFDLDHGDDVEMLSFDAPGGNTQEFWRFTSAVAMCALDLPYSMWDSAAGNFFGNKTAWLSYERSCDVRRARCLALRYKIAELKYRAAIRARDITLPRSIDARNIRRLCAFTPRKMPWWRPLEEVTAAITAIQAGLSNPYKECAESDLGNFEDNIRAIKKAMDFAAAEGVPLAFVVGDELAAQAKDSAAKRQAAAAAAKTQGAAA